MRKRLAVGVSSAVLSAVAFWLTWVVRNDTSDQILLEESPAELHRIAEPTYSWLAIKARLGDCDSAYQLGRHNAFFAVNADQAIRWYRLAAKCPHAAAKGELLGILMHFSDRDSEVDRLLAEIKELDSKAAESDRAAVESVRKSRK